MGVLKDYFSFSKRERTGGIVLIIIIILVFLLPEFYPEPEVYVDTKEIAEFKKQVSGLKTLQADSGDRIEINTGSNYEKSYTGDRQKAFLFYFDPNTLSGEGWKKLGIGERTVGTILNYRSKGGEFKKPEDLGRIYGMKKEKYEELLPFVRIAARDEEKKKDEGIRVEIKRSGARTITSVDLNEADTTMLIALPGIGSKLANRIVSFRDKLGGYYSIEQVGEVYGLPDSTFQKIRSYLRCDSSLVRKLDINRSDENDLKNHPYIKWNIARAIVNYRLQHGPYERLDNLLDIDIISPPIFQKISPYLKVQ